MKTLSELPMGKEAVLNSLEGDPDLVNRLMDMGLHPGSRIEYVNRMLGKGPFIIRFGSTLLALREEEALCLKVIV